MNVSIMTLKHLVIWVESAEIHGAVITAMNVTSLSAVMRGKGGEVGMTKQRMIELLEIEHVCMLRKSHDVCDGNCCVCELAQDDYELHEMYISVISTLKAQEARLVTYDDFHSGREDGGEAIPCWKEARSKTRRSGWAVIVYGKMLADRETGVARYWTARPTEEQMQEEAWPGE